MIEVAQSPRTDASKSHFLAVIAGVLIGIVLESPWRSWRHSAIETAQTSQGVDYGRRVG